MSEKYSEEIKAEAKLRAETLGFVSHQLARDLGMPLSTLYFFAEQGKWKIKFKKRRISDSIKREIVRRALNGEQPADLQVEYEVSRTTVHRILQAYFDKNRGARERFAKIKESSAGSYRGSNSIPALARNAKITPTIGLPGAALLDEAIGWAVLHGWDVGSLKDQTEFQQARTTLREAIYDAEISTEQKNFPSQSRKISCQNQSLN